MTRLELILDIAGIWVGLIVLILIAWSSLHFKDPQ